MANEEAFTLDGLALNDGVTFAVLEANLDPPSPRYLWASSVDTEGSALVTDPLHENRDITLKVSVIPQSTMDLALAKVAQLRDKLKKASATAGGIGLVWTPATGTLSCTFDVLAGEIQNLPVNWEDGWLAKAPTMTVRLIAKPYWRGTEVTTSTASSSTPFVTLEVASVPGDMPALGRLIVTDTASQSRRHVEWGLEGPSTYNSGTSLLVDSDNLVTSGFVGTQTTATGAYDPNATGNSTITATLVAGETVAVCGTGNLSHVGAFRVKARVQSTSLSNLFRFKWQSGDGAFSPNDWVSVSRTGGWVEVDLGMIQITAATLGTQRWTGQVEVLSASSSPGTVLVDYLVLVPVAGYGVARASYDYLPGVLVGYDQFVGTTAGNALNTRSAPAGGTWATSGDTTDFVFADNFVNIPTDGVESITRTTVAAETSGRYAILGSTNYTDTQVDTRFITFNGAAVSEPAVVARWTDANNHVRFVAPDDQSGRTTRIEQVVAGTVTILVEVPSTRYNNDSIPYRLRLIVFASGRALGYLLDNNGAVIVQLQASSSALATGGTLASGKPGLRDQAVIPTSSSTRRYTGFSASIPATEPIAVYGGRSLQVTYQTAIRQDSTGTYYGRPKSYQGDMFTVPAGTSRVLVKAKRNDVEAAGALDDTVTDATQIQVAYTPRGLVVPR